MDSSSSSSMRVDDGAGSMGTIGGVTSGCQFVLHLIPAGPRVGIRIRDESMDGLVLTTMLVPVGIAYAVDACLEEHSVDWTP
jgi:hypothetical protein